MLPNYKVRPVQNNLKVHMIRKSFHVQVTGEIKCFFAFRSLCDQEICKPFDLATKLFSLPKLVFHKFWIILKIIRVGIHKTS